MDLKVDADPQERMHASTTTDNSSPQRCIEGFLTSKQKFKAQSPKKKGPVCREIVRGKSAQGPVGR